GKRRVADLPGDAQGFAAIGLSLTPLPGGESDLAAQRVKPRDVLHGAGGSGLAEPSLHLGQGPVRGPQSQEGIRNTGAQLHGPAPPVRPKTLLGAAERVFQQGEGLLRFPKVQIVKPQVDQGAELDIGVPNTLAKVSAVAVVLGGALEIAQLLVQPAQGVGESPQDEHVITVPGFGETVVNGGEGLGVFSQPNVG